MRHGQMLPSALRGSETAHGDAPQLVIGHELTNRLPVFAGVRHAYVLECTFLGTWYTECLNIKIVFLILSRVQ